jgi:hypothetical protein
MNHSLSKGRNSDYKLVYLISVQDTLQFGGGKILENNIEELG